MKLRTVYARFYKSFNFDHLRKAHPLAKAKPWEQFEGAWYPYVEVGVEDLITTIVGANESGKSHLLSAVEKAITGEGFQQRDLCRYSPFFNVEKGKTCWPHLGVGWSNVTPPEADLVMAALGETSLSFRNFAMFREGPEQLTIYIPNDDGSHTPYPLTGGAATDFGRAFLPRPFRIKPEVALPNSVPLAWLVTPSKENGALHSRRWRADLLEGAAVVRQYWQHDAARFAQQAPKMYNAASSYFNSSNNIDTVLSESQVESLNLARSLLIQLANLDPQRLQDLSSAIADGDDGHANALMSRINDQLAKQLNFPKWWVQDRDFSLRVTPREMDLVFTIRDRTGTEYTFNERSSGLKYFLSYLIQSQVHEPPAGRSEILLMDEPDTYLSAEAQQDLLKIFDDFAQPTSDANPIQVLYVTHSPFLIDKNHAERIRVLQKGKGFDGTRVIRNASQNHYEPLRSAFGAFVGETAFIGACNLLVEGVADQIIISGMARLTRRSSVGLQNDTLDLNRLVIVPCGSAGQVPYMLYLIRGRDTEKPPVVVLLDSDDAGDDAAGRMRGKDKRMSRLLQKDYVLQLGDLGLFGDDKPSRVEIEDLLPIGLAVAAANDCLSEIGRFRDEKVVTLTAAMVTKHLKMDVGLFSALNLAAGASGLHIEKIAFARAVVGLCKLQPVHEGLAEDVEAFFGRMKVLFQAINVVKRKAERDASRDKVGTLVDRQQKLFLQDNPVHATKEQVSILFEQIGDVLDESAESDSVRSHMMLIRRDFHLDDEPSTSVPDFDTLKTKMTTLHQAFHIDQVEAAPE
ncbi:MAG: ATP-dependent endonuclease of the family-like protein [Devosia sp.]|uniref:AAA family ATPase n=1 Tax=Devosia sp. TaxID=1871048 RepID=UPI0026314C53|nr:AAA family ATPase [Devosia sp.]MDB5538554.1 ATP-dependent endonuclease of the family-like protein [Devosia sp.]